MTAAVDRPRRLPATSTLLGQLLRATGVKQREVARRLNIHPNVVSFWHVGRRVLTLDVLASIARICGYEVYVELRPIPESTASIRVVTGGRFGGVVRPAARIGRPTR